MEKDETEKQKQRELARKEFARNNPTFGQTSKDKIYTERFASNKKFGEIVACNLDAHPSSNATSRSKRQKAQNVRSVRDKQPNQIVQNNYQAVYMPAHIGEKRGSNFKGPPSFLVEQNEDILNLLEPKV